MFIEVEKKYRLTGEQQQMVLDRLPEIGATLKKKEFEENTLYNNQSIQLAGAILRLRRVGERATLTYKRRFPSNSQTKRQLEHETEISDPAALQAILQALRFYPTLVYEKRRASWELGAAEIVIDELPFGLFMEIEASETEIEKVEGLLSIKELKPEPETYPSLTLKHGRKINDVITARFDERP